MAQRFLADLELGGEEARRAVVDFMPASFAAVDALCGAYQRAERRRVFTTPKSFLELIKLYRSLLVGGEWRLGRGEGQGCMQRHAVCALPAALKHSLAAGHAQCRCLGRALTLRPHLSHPPPAGRQAADGAGQHRAAGGGADQAAQDAGGGGHAGGAGGRLAGLWAVGWEVTNAPLKAGSSTPRC